VKNFKKWQSHNQQRKQVIINFSLNSAIINVPRTYITQRNLEHSLKLPLITPNWINLQNGRNQSCFKISCNNNSINNLIPPMVQSPWGYHHQEQPPLLRNSRRCLSILETKMQVWLVPFSIWLPPETSLLFWHIASNWQQW